jgi:hypothetical protein
MLEMYLTSNVFLLYNPPAKSMPRVHTHKATVQKDRREGDEVKEKNGGSMGKLTVTVSKT